MPVKHSRMHLVALVLLLTAGAVRPCMAGTPVVGSVTGSVNATLGGEALLPNTVVFSGDTLKVGDGVAIVRTRGGSQLTFGRATDASLTRAQDAVGVLLEGGSVFLYHDSRNEGLSVKISNLSIAPAPETRTMGEIAMVGEDVVVIAKEGVLRIDGNGKTMEVIKGQTVTLEPVTTKSAQTQPGNAPSSSTQAHSKTLRWAAIASISGGAALVALAIKKHEDANDVKSRAAAAAAAALAAEEAAVAAGCALNKVANSQGLPSPYTPPAGFSCGP